MEERVNGEKIKEYCGYQCTIGVLELYGMAVYTREARCTME